MLFIPLTEVMSSSPSSSNLPNQNIQVSQSKYGELLAVIEEIGKDIRPTYAGSKNASERLKKGKSISLVDDGDFLQIC